MSDASHIPQIVGGVIALLMIATVLVLTRRLKFPFTVALVLIGVGCRQLPPFSARHLCAGDLKSRPI